MNESTAEWLKIGLVFVLLGCLFLLDHKNDRLREENKALKAENETLLASPPDGFNGHNGVMFHLLASENYRLGGEAKNFLPKDMVIPHDEVNDLLKNGWHFPNGAKNGAIVKQPNVPDKTGR